MEIFGKRIKELREEKGLSQKALATALDTSRQNVSRWEKSFCEPDQETMVRIARFFNVTMDYLFGMEE